LAITAGSGLSDGTAIGGIDQGDDGRQVAGDHFTVNGEQVGQFAFFLLVLHPCVQGLCQFLGIDDAEDFAPAAFPGRWHDFASPWIGAEAQTGSLRRGEILAKAEDAGNGMLTAALR
jgi:hypothetical protein